MQLLRLRKAARAWLQNSGRHGCKRISLPAHRGTILQLSQFICVDIVIVNFEKHSFCNMHVQNAGALLQQVDCQGIH